MKIKTELLNLVTGLIVTFCGGLNIFFGHFEIGMNWIIFGAMYLVMGDYLQNQEMQTKLEKITDLIRKLFSWIGLSGSLVLAFYYLKLFVL